MAEETGIGAVSFLFSDIESSTRLWERHPDDMSGALERHDEIMRSAFAPEGQIFSAAGDSFGAVFESLPDACAAAAVIQTELAAVDWPDHTPIRVRLGLHTGVAEERDGVWFGPAVNRAARIMSAAHGGQTLVSARVADTIRDVLPLTDLGLQHLKDLAEPEHLWQLGAGTFPPLRVVFGADVTLPEPATPLVGRAKDQAAVLDLLVAHRLVTVTGTGGIGKTRLAVAAAAQAAGRFPGGVAFTDLSSHSRDEDVPEAVAAAIGIRQGAAETMMGALRRWYGDREALLVLDNCEQVVDGARVVAETLVESGAGVRVLATSRQRLGGGTEVLYPLGPIDPVPARSMLVARIRDLVPRFDDTDHGEALDALTERLDGIPLAVELAAARCRGLSPAQLLERLGGRPQLLSDPGRADRHQSLDATISGSYESLSEREQLVFSRCAVFVGSFDLDAAEEIVGASPLTVDHVAEGLGALVDASLLQRDADDGTFTMLVPVRQAARSRLHEFDGALERHYEHFRGVARRVGVEMEGPREEAWGRLARARFAEIRAAWQEAVRRGDADAAGEIVFGLWRHAFDGMHLEVLRWAEDTMASFGATDPALTARCLGTSVACFIHLGRYDDLHAAVRRIDELGVSAAPVLPMAHAIQALAFVNQEAEDDAIATMTVAVEAARDADDRWLEAMALIFLREFDAAAAVCTSLQNPSTWSWFNIFRGFSHAQEGHYVAARGDFETAAALAREVGNTQAMAVALNELGVVASLAGSDDTPLADIIRPVDQAIEIFIRLRTPWQLWNSLEALAQALARRGEIEHAATLWSSVDAAGVTPPAAAHRTRSAKATGSAVADEPMDVWQTADFARSVVRELLVSPATERRAGEAG